jgi:hypothetical protein
MYRCVYKVGRRWVELPWHPLTSDRPLWAYKIHLREGRIAFVEYDLPTI